MYTKESIFPLYVGKCRVKAKSNDFIKGEAVGDFNSYFLQTKELEFTNQGCDYIVPISDCTLLLKPLSKMSDQTEIVEHDLLTGKIIHLSRHPRVIFEDLQQAINEHFLWLINHGYAISDELFELNIAEETNG